MSFQKRVAEPAHFDFGSEHQRPCSVPRKGLRMLPAETRRPSALYSNERWTRFLDELRLAPRVRILRIRSSSNSQFQTVRYSPGALHTAAPCGSHQNNG